MKIFCYIFGHVWSYDPFAHIPFCARCQEARKYGDGDRHCCIDYGLLAMKIHNHVFNGEKCVGSYAPEGECPVKRSATIPK